MIDWTGVLSKSFRKARRRRGPNGEYYSVESRPILRGTVGAIAYGAAVVFLLATTTPWIAGLVAVAGARRLTIDRRENTPSTPVRRPTAHVAAPVFGVTKVSVFQGDDGPTVSVITPDGEIRTRSFTSWPSASRYVAKTEAALKAARQPFEYLSEKI